MTFTAPRTWSTDTNSSNSRLTASAFNTEIRDNLTALRGLNDYSVRLRLTSDVSLTTLVETVVNWDDALWNIGSMWSSGSPSRITVAVTGLYELCGSLNFQDDSGGARRVSYRVNGATVYRVTNRGTTDAGYVYADFHDVISLTAGDYIEILAFQDSPSTISLDSGSDNSYVTLTLLGETSPATWTAPSTADWTLHTGLTAADLNTKLRDTVKTLRGMQGYAVKVSLAANQTIPAGGGAGSTVAPTWNVAQFTVGSGMWSSAVSATEITLPVTGWWTIFGRVSWQRDQTGQRRADLKVIDALSNTTINFTYDGVDGVTSTGIAQSWADVLYLSASSKAIMRVYQESGSTLDVIGGSTGTVFGAYLVGTTV